MTTKVDILRLWPQGKQELQGFIRHLQRGHAEITAAQIALAIELADKEFERIACPIYDARAARLVSIISKELNRQAEGFAGSMALSVYNAFDETTSVGVDGVLNLEDLANAILESLK